MALARIACLLAHFLDVSRIFASASVLCALLLQVLGIAFHFFGVSSLVLVIGHFMTILLHFYLNLYLDLRGGTVVGVGGAE